MHAVVEATGAFPSNREKKNSAALNAQALWRELSGIAKGISLDAREGSEQTRPDVSTASRLPQIFPVYIILFFLRKRDSYTHSTAKATRRGCLVKPELYLQENSMTHLH